MFACKLLVHAEHVSHFPSSYAYVSGWYIGFRSDMSPQFEDECLTESHYLLVGLAFGVEIGSSLGPSHRKCCQRILECLLECEEFQDGLIYGRMEPDTSLIRPDGAVVLYPVAHVGLYPAVIVCPGDAEGNDSVGNAYPFNEVAVLEFGVAVVYFFDAFQDFGYRLVVLGLIRESPFEPVKNFF